MLFKNSFKYSLLSFDELVINLDRLSRFKLPEDSFPRVFESIIFKHLIFPKYSKKDIINIDEHLISKMVKTIWNESVLYTCAPFNCKLLTNNALKYIIKTSFKNYDKRTSVFINTNLYIDPILNKLDYNNVPYNLKFLIKAQKVKSIKYKQLREKYKLCFPIEKILIVEGITEEILLPVFADKLNNNFNQRGIYVLGAGGKSKSPTLYLSLKDKVRIPIILLFDSDAEKICFDLKKYLRKQDGFIILKNGEFEDILSKNLIKRTLNKEYLPIVPILMSELNKKIKMCDKLDYFYKSRHLGEFKKVKFAKILSKNIKYQTDITSEIKNIIQNII